jgi:hypothetical protein
MPQAYKLSLNKCIPKLCNPERKHEDNHNVSSDQRVVNLMRPSPPASLNFLGAVLGVRHPCLWISV